VQQPASALGVRRSTRGTKKIVDEESDEQETDE
jgi:hypothetical protein